METTQGLYISTVKQVHMNHTALLCQRSELRRSARRNLVMKLSGRTWVTLLSQHSC